jgi:hypothetical protein
VNIDFSKRGERRKKKKNDERNQLKRSLKFREWKLF